MLPEVQVAHETLRCYGAGEKAVSLRQASEDAAGPPAALDIRFPHLAQTARSIATKWADRPGRTPPPFQLDAIVHSVRDQWQEQKSLGGLANREIRWLPHVIFHPEADRNAWLARDAGFMTAALARMREQTRAMRGLLRNVIRLWPKELGAAARIQSVLKEELRAATSPRLCCGRRRRWGARSSPSTPRGS